MALGLRVCRWPLRRCAWQLGVGPQCACTCVVGLPSGIVRREGREARGVEADVQRLGCHEGLQSRPSHAMYVGLAAPQCVAEGARGRFSATEVYV